MDNVTHTLLGIAAAEAVSVSRRKARVPLWVASAVANNLPDLDVLATTFFYRDKLGYLLHHRGHTHTLLLTPLLALVWLFCFWLWGRKKELPWKEIIFLVLVGGPLHVLADFWNSYGVHPFWPWDNRWFYGDMVFIVEPWIWLSLLPAIFFASTGRWARGICLFLTVWIVGIAWVVSLVPWPLALVLTVFTAAAFWAGRNWTSRGGRITVAWAVVITALGTTKMVGEGLRLRYAGTGIEVALTPLPANPLCWIAQTARLGETEYEASVRVVSPAPGWWSVDRCPSLYGSSTTAPLVGAVSPSPAERDLKFFRAPKAEFVELAKHCRMEGFLRYARIPFWVKETGGGWVIGDLRFDREGSLGFGEMPLDGPCPRHVPPWRGRFLPPEA